MVLTELHNHTIMESTNKLKFGIDRILSQDLCKKTSEQQSKSPPCAACISSVYRCCKQTCNSDIDNSTTASTLYHHGYYTHNILTPQAVRPFTNVLIQAEPSQTQSNQSSNPIISGKRKRSWSRAVFSNLQRKGLEKRFQLQKYITKPDRRQLAATLGLTDAQVKVWFQNRRMKWRHTKDSKQSANEEPDLSVIVTTEEKSDSEDGDIDVQTLDS